MFETDDDQADPGDPQDRAILTDFARAVVDGGAAYAVAGSDGIAAVPSKQPAAASLDLLWSARAEALRWADVLTDSPRIVALDLATLLGSYLPGLAAAGRAVGPDWSDGPDEAECSARSVTAALRDAMLADFDDKVAADRHLWLLRSGSEACGYAVLRGVHERLAVPLFASRDEAHAAAAELWPDGVPVRQSIGEFTRRTLFGAIEHKLVFAPGFVPGLPALVHMPWDIKGRLQSLARRDARAVA